VNKWVALMIVVVFGLIAVFAVYQLLNLFHYLMETFSRGIP
jgi:dolichyl-phosphate-mannose--protein O-mannosyl transferase